MKRILIFTFVFLFMNIQAFAKDFRFVQVTDVRYDKNAENQILPDVIKRINSEDNVDFVVFTGDNIVSPDKEQLKVFLKVIKKLKKPSYLVLGDKDVNKRKKLGKKEYIKIVKKEKRGFKPNAPDYIFERKGIVFIVADGSKEVLPSTTGYYKDDVLEWVDANLDKYSGKNVIILQHFPIIPPAKRETYYTFRADEYLGVIENHKNVKAVISGHFGINKEDIINGVSHISTAPIPNYRVIDVIDYDTNNPTIWSEVR